MWRKEKKKRKLKPRPLKDKEVVKCYTGLIKTVSEKVMLIIA